MSTIYQEELILIKQNLEREQEYTTLARIVEESEGDRTALKDFILTEEGGETISFLTEIEKMARNSGVDLVTENLDVVTVQGSVYDDLHISFKVEGQIDKVHDLILLLESLPYHSKMRRVELAKVGGTERFGGKVVVSLSIISHD